MTKLLKLKILSYKNSLLYGKDRKKKLAAWVFFSALAGGILYLLLAKVPEAQKLGPAGNFLLEKGLQVGFLFSLFYLLIGGINTSLNSLYLSGDLNLLRSLPVRTKTVFTYKFVSAWIDNTTFIFSIVIPILIGYGLFIGANAAFYPVMVIGLFAFTALMTGIASLMTLLAVKFTPPDRLRKILQALGALVGAILYAVFYIKFYAGDSGAGVTSGQLTRLEEIFSHPFVEWLPSGWLASSLSFFQDEVEFSFFLLKFGLLLAAAGIVFWISRSVLMEAFGRGATAFRQVPTEKPDGETKKGGIGGYGKAKIPLPSTFLAIARKEFLTYRRNLQILSQLFFPLAVSIVVPIIIFTRAGKTETIVTPYFGFIAAWFFLYMAGSQITLLSFFSESGNTPGIFSSPLAGKRLVTTKVFTYFLPTVLIAETYHVIGSLITGSDTLWLATGLILIPPVCLGVNSIGVSVAASFGNMEAEEPNNAVSSLWRFLMFPVVIIYLGLTGAFVVCMLHPESIPYLNYFGQLIRRVGGVVLLALLTFSTSYFSIRYAEEKLLRREW